jgi:hypothetical protein
VVRHPERLDVRQTQITEAALNAAMNNLDYGPIVARTGPVFAAGVDTAHSRIIMHVADPDGANNTNAGASVGVPVWFVAGSGSEAASNRNDDDTYAPPYRGGHGIILCENSTCSGTARGCTIGFAAKNALGVDGAFTAGHCARQSPNTYYVIHGDLTPVYIGNATNGSSVFGGDTDYYAFTMVPGKTTNPTVFTDWPNVINVKSTDEGHEQVGYTRIKSGRSSFYGSGTLQSTNWDPDGSGTRYTSGFRKASYFCLEGDSGGPVWHPLDGRAWASGLMTTTGTECGLWGCSNFGTYAYIRIVLTKSGFTLKTTST